MSDIPSKVDHVQVVTENIKNVQKQSLCELKGREEELALFGTCLSALYQASTCHRKCWGGNHVFEALIGRSYNLSCASYSLICSGFYDEALNLIRSLGEIANLIMMSIVNPPKISEWVNADKATRMRKFSPVEVRKILGDDVVMNGSLYANLCEAYIHITPMTKPNKHIEGISGHVGGMLQLEGIDKSLEQLLNTIGPIAIMVCKYFQYDDLFQEIDKQLNT